KHFAIIFFGISHHQRVLFRAEIGIGRNLAVPLQVIDGFASQLDEVLYNGIFTRPRHVETGCVSVSGNVLSELLETAVVMARAPCRFGVDIAQVSEHRFDRSVQTVEVESIESTLSVFKYLLVIVFAQPANEIEHVGVSPHPLRKTLKST